jgi:trk system potassium uptake protein TrkA
VVLGAGAYGVSVASRLTDAILVDSDPGRVEQLKRERPELRLVFGDGADPAALFKAGIETAEFVILAAATPETNSKMAQVVRSLGTARLIARPCAEEQRRMLRDAGVDHVLMPGEDPVRGTLNAMDPRAPTTTQMVLSDGSPAVGKPVSALHLPEDVVLGAVVRGGHLHDPAPDFVLAKGDVLSLQSLGILEPEIREGIAGGAFVLLRAKGAVSAGRIGGLQVLLAGLRLRLEEVEGPERWGRLCSAARAGRSLVAFELRRAGPFSLEPPRRIVRTLLDSPAPLLIVRQPGQSRIVTLVGTSPVSEASAMAALAFATAHSAKVVVVVDHTVEGSRALATMSHVDRVGAASGVDVETILAEGSVVLEYVKQVRNPATTLVVLNWPPLTIPRDLAWRVMRDSEASVLVMKAPR